MCLAGTTVAAPTSDLALKRVKLIKKKRVKKCRHLPSHHPPPHHSPPLTHHPLPQYVAVYDYEAGDDDEVTIKEGDVVINGETIAEGWMVGTNVRTGLHGMLPSNYVEICP